VTDGKISRYIFFFEDDQAALLKLLGSGGGDINQTDADGNTALHRLCTGFYDVSKVGGMASLIASGADVNATNHSGQTPLHLASGNIGGWDGNDPPVNEPFQLLLYHKANVNAQDNDGLTPLHILASSDSSFKREATRALLDAGADPNLRDKHGRTPAHLFLSGKWPWTESAECMDMLVKAGADLSAKDDEGKTPLHCLAALGNQQPLFFMRGIADIFVAAKVDFDARDNDGNTPMLIAAKTGTHEVFDWLLKQGANLDATNNAGETPRILSARNPNPFAMPSAQSAETDIFQAVREGKVDAAARLLDADPQLVNQTNQFKQTPLFLAVTLHQTNMIGFLERHGANWDEATAVLAGRTDALQTILKDNPSAVGTMLLGKGLIHIAAANGNVDMVKMLIAANCNLQAKDNWGLSPLGYALITKNKQVQEVLLQHGANENFFDAVYANDLPTVTALLAKDKSEASALNHGNNSAVDIAAAAGHTEILKLLLKSASFNHTATGVGQYAIHLAAFYNQTNTLTLLIREGANVNQTDQLGFTPLHWATIRGAKESVAILIKHHADANKAIVRVDAGHGLFFGPGQQLLLGDTPLHLAALNGQTNVVSSLLTSGADVNAANERMLTPLDLSDGMPMNPLNIIMVQRSILEVMEPLGINQSPANLLQTRREGQKAVAALIQAAGGKHSQNRQPFGGWQSQPSPFMR